MAETEKYDNSTRVDGPAGEARTNRLPPRFEIRGELGRGGMGAVIWAYDEKLKQEVAVKILTADPNDDSLAARFRQEAKELSSFTHPNIVTLLDFGSFEGEDYIVLEFLKGGNLLDWISQKPSIPEVVERFTQIAQGLDYIHHRGIVHRDLKPENILLTSEGQPRITDFGVARRMEQQTRFTAAGTILGTSTYMAPEQIMSSEVGPPADIYSLGVCLFEALTGQPPFIATQHFALLQAHLTETAPSVRSKRDDVPEELDRLVNRMLKKTPEERPASAQEVITALREINVSTPVEPKVFRKIERPAAWSALMGHMQEIKAGQGFGCHLVGPTGSGRSYLLKQFCLEAKTKGVRTIVVAPTHEPVEALKRLWFLLGPSCPLREILAVEGPTGAANWIRRRLEGCSQPTVLVVDDIERHLPTTLAVFRALGQLTPPPSAGWIISSTPAQRFSEAGGSVVELTPMSQGDLNVLFDSVRGFEPGPELSNWLSARSAGWPRQAKLLANALPDSVVDPPSDPTGQVLHNFDRLSENARLTLEVLCLAHQPVPYDLMVAGTGLAHRTLDKGLSEIVQAGYAEEDWTQPDHFRVAHDLYRELLAKGLPERTSRRLHMAIAAFYERTEFSTERGRHLLAAGEKDKAFQTLMYEADYAKELGFLPLAHNLLKAALTCAGSPTTDVAESKARLAEVALDSGKVEESKKLLADLAPKSLSGKLQADLVRATMANRESEIFDESVLLTPRGTSPTTIREMHLSIVLHRQLAKAASRAEDFERASEHLEQALKLAHTVNEPDVWGQVLVASGFLKLQQGEAAEAEVEARQAIEKTRHSENPRWRTKSYELLGEVQMALGAPARAALSFQQALEIAKDALLDKRCTKLERKLYKAQKGESLTPLNAPRPVVVPHLPATEECPPTVVDEVSPLLQPQGDNVQVRVVEEPRSTSHQQNVAPVSVEPLSQQVSQAQAAESQPSQPPVRRSPVLLLAVAGLLVLALLGGAIAGYQNWSNQPGTLTLHSHPPTVDLKYPGLEAPIKVTSGTPINLPPGSYKLEISADGFKAETRQIEIQRAGQLQLDFKLVSTFGALKLLNWPEKTTLTIEGVKTEVKPGAEIRLPVGKHKLVAEKRLFEKVERTVVIRPAEIEELTIKLKPVLGDLAITTNPPNAVVFLDGKRHSGKSNTTVGAIKPGDYDVKVTLDGYYAAEKRVEVKAGQASKLEFSLEKIVEAPPAHVEPPQQPTWNPAPYDPGPPPASSSSGGSGGSGSGGGGIDWEY